MREREREIKDAKKSEIADISNTERAAINNKMREGSFHLNAQIFHSFTAHIFLKVDKGIL